MRLLSREMEYVPEADRTLEPEERTVWELEVPTYEAFAEIRNRVVQLEGGQGAGEDGKKDETRTIIRAGTEEMELLKHGVRGWRNLRDNQGKEVPVPKFNRHNYAPLMDVLRLVPADIRAELAREIRGRSRLGKEEQGNSDSLRALPSPGDDRAAAHEIVSAH